MRKCHKQHTQQLQQLHNQMYQNNSTLTDWVCAQLNFLKKQLKVRMCSDLKHLKEKMSTENSALMTHYNVKFSELKQNTELKSQNTESYLRKELSAMNEILKHLIMARKRELNVINPSVDTGCRVVVAQSRSKHKKLFTAASSRVLRSSSQPKSSRRRYDQKTHSFLE